MTGGGGAAPGDVAPQGDQRPRLAFLAYWTTEFDSRLERMARSAIDAGYEVVVYGRLQAGLAAVEERAGYRVIRVRVVPRAARWLGDGSAGGAPAVSPAHAAGTAPGPAAGPGASPVAKAGPVLPPAPGAAGSPARRGGIRRSVRTMVAGGPLEQPYAAARRAWHRARRWLHPRDRLGDRRLAPRRWTWFLESIAGWATTLDGVAEPADVWHALGIGGLPAAVRQRDRLGGTALYDSRDVFVGARSMVTASPLRRRLFATCERRLAHRCDAIITVNEGAADLLARQLGCARPTVVMNVPSRGATRVARDDRIRATLGLPATTGIVLYQGALLTERGIEQGLDAILEVPDAALVLLGYGELLGAIRAAAAAAPHLGRVFTLPAVPPGELLAWTAAADVMLIAIQGSTPNHRIATPNKLFEAMAAGIPVVVSDLPGMASIVRRVGCGLVVDGSDPGAIAAGLRQVLALPSEARREMGARGAAAIEGELAWEVQAERLMAVYGRLAASPRGRRT